MEFRSADGHVITMCDFSMRRTYEGFLVGTPAAASRYLRRKVLTKLDRNRHWDNLKTLVIDPGGEALPQVLCTARFMKSTDPDPDIWRTELRVVWFIDEFATDVRDAVVRGIQGLDWAAHASSVRYEDI
jgi:hypothetical protein